MNGTRTTKRAPKTLQTILGALMIAGIVLFGLAHQGTSGGRSVQPTARPATPSPSASPARHK